MRTRLVSLALAWASAAFLPGCGGGGGGGASASAPEPSPPATATLSGVAAVGKPMAGATLTVYDRHGAAAGTTTVAADGTYAITIPASVPAPLVVEATLDDLTLVSAFAETRDTRLNVTPLTNLIAARLAPDGDPLSLRTNAAAVTPQALSARVDELKAILQPLLSAVGDSVDPLTGIFAADGTGHDAVLDSLDVQIRTAGKVSNIELTVRAASAQPIRTLFTSADSSVSPLPSVAASALPPPGIGGLLDDLMRRMTACFALEVGNRASGVIAATVIAPQCRTLFIDDDPSKFRHNGMLVGYDGAFATLFSHGYTRSVYRDAQFDYLRNNEEKDIVFSYHLVDVVGNRTLEQSVARKVGEHLKLVGNGFPYTAYVRPAVQERSYINQPVADFLSVGYNIVISNRLDGYGNSRFSKVEVTTPFGQKLTFRPVAGRAALVIQRPDGSLTNTSVIRLAAKFRDPATAGLNPAAIEPQLLFADPPFTDEELRAIPGHGLWRLEFFHAQSGIPNAVQPYLTSTRAPTLAEAEAMRFAQLLNTAKAELRGASAQQGAIVFGPPSAREPNVADLSTAGGGDFWTVPAGASAPNLVALYGRGPDPDGSGPLPRPAFDDFARIGTTFRKSYITCKTFGPADTHCDFSTGVRQYAEDSRITALELNAVGPRHLDVSTMSALYYVLPR